MLLVQIGLYERFLERHDDRGKMVLPKRALEIWLNMADVSNAAIAGLTRMVN